MHSLSFLVFYCMTCFAHVLQILHVYARSQHPQHLCALELPPISISPQQPPESENIQPFDIAVALALTLTRVEARMRAAKQGTANEVSTAHRTRVSDTANCISEMKAQLVAGRKPK